MSDISEQGPDHGRPILIVALVALGIATVAVVAVAAFADGGPFWSDGFQLTAYMCAAVAVGALLGLIFAVPRTRVADDIETTERFASNSNLEQISDWLTKILVGAGLVQLGRLPTALGSLGDFLGTDLEVSNSAALCVAVVLYGAGVGFIVTYLWSRLRLRVLMEDSEQQANERSRTTQVLKDALTRANAESPDPEPADVVAEAASRASDRLATVNAKPRGQLLWVDDFPSNNVAIADALREVGVRIDFALSTDDAVERLGQTHYSLVITDLGRIEGDQDNPEAGLDLLRYIRQMSSRPPVIVFSGQRAVDRREELLAAGAVEVTNRATVVFSRAVDILLR